MTDLRYCNGVLNTCFQFVSLCSALLSNYWVVTELLLHQKCNRHSPASVTDTLRCNIHILSLFSSFSPVILYRCGRFLFFWDYRQNRYARIQISSVFLAIHVRIPQQYHLSSKVTSLHPMISNTVYTSSTPSSPHSAPPCRRVGGYWINPSRLTISQPLLTLR